MEIKTEHYTGTNCTGTSGSANRTLTISNTGSTTNNGFLVYASGVNLALTSEYTASHLSASTVVTFIVPIWDDQTIAVNYTQQIEGLGTQGTTDDFINGPLADFGVTVTRTPVTTTTNFHGDKTYADGTNGTMEVVFENPNTKYPIDMSGITKVYDARMFTKSDATINKYDKITHDSKVYRVDNVSLRHFGTEAIFKTVNLFYIKNE